MSEFFTTMDSPIGELLLCSDGESLIGVFTHGPKPKQMRNGDQNPHDQRKLVHHVLDDLLLLHFV